jgi:hypothetical protein
MFTTGALVSPSDANPLALPERWSRDTVITCLARFSTTCAESYATVLNCLAAACSDGPQCVGATRGAIDTCEADAIGGGQGVCGAPARASFGAGGACADFLAVEAGVAPSVESCFAQPTEATDTDDGLRAYFVRVGGYFCGAP